LRWLADENFNNDILRALRRRNRNIDIVRAQDAGLTGVDDEALLAWAAGQERILLTALRAESPALTLGAVTS
jgi:hypothetical protein